MFQQGVPSLTQPSLLGAGAPAGASPPTVRLLTVFDLAEMPVRKLKEVAKGLGIRITKEKGHGEKKGRPKRRPELLDEIVRKLGLEGKATAEQVSIPGENWGYPAKVVTPVK